MPALSPELNRVYNLNLMMFPHRPGGEAADSVSSQLVHAFLEELYAASGVENPSQDHDFQSMTAGLKPESRLPLIRMVLEQPALSCAKYGVAYHFVCASEDQPADRCSTTNPCVRDYEEDLLALTWRDSPPFWHEVFEIPEKFQHLNLVVPPRLLCEREGLQMQLLTSRVAGPNPPALRRMLKLRVSRTVFQEGISILHLVFGPDASEEDHDDTAQEDPPWCLSEWELTKMAHGWGGSLNKVVEETDAAKFSPRSDPAQEPWGILELVAQVMEHLPGLKLLDSKCRYGTVQIVGDSRESPLNVSEMHEHVQKLFEGEKLPDGCPILQQIQAIDGIYAGDFDCMSLDRSELLDTLRSLECEPDRLRGIHKATLLEIISDSRAFDVASEVIGISPYVLFPHAVAIYNDHLQKVAETAARESTHLRDKKLQAIELRMREALQRQTLPDVFHYSDEQQYFEWAMELRGLNQRREVLLGKLAEVENRFNDYRDRRTRWFQNWITVVGLVLAAAQAMSVIDSFSPGTLYEMGQSFKNRFTSFFGQ